MKLLPEVLESMYYQQIWVSLMNDLMNDLYLALWWPLAIFHCFSVLGHQDSLQLQSAGLASIPQAEHLHFGHSCFLAMRSTGVCYAHFLCLSGKLCGACTGNQVDMHNVTLETPSFCSPVLAVPLAHPVEVPKEEAVIARLWGLRWAVASDYWFWTALPGSENGGYAPHCRCARIMSVICNSVGKLFLKLVNGWICYNNLSQTLAMTKAVIWAH